MTTLREAAEAVMEQLKHGWVEERDPVAQDLKAALAEPEQEPEPGEYHGWVLREVLFDNGEPVGHREPVQEPTGKDSLQVEQAIAETATTQQQVEQTPPSEYRRGYWAGFEIGKREGRIEAEGEHMTPTQEAAMRQALEALEFLSLDFFMLDPISPGREAGNKAIAALKAALAEPVQEPVAWMVYTLDGKSVCVTDNPADFTEQHKALPLYTSDPIYTMLCDLKQQGNSNE